jgi:hypothetical protein
MPQTVQFDRQPLKPDCLVWYADDPCDRLIQQYHQAALLSQQQQWQVSVTAPLQKQIADQQRQIKALQLQIATQTSAALQTEAHTAAIFEGIGAGLGVAFALFIAVAFFRWLAGDSPLMNQEHKQAAS